MSETTAELRQEIAYLKQQLEVVADGVTEQKYLQQAKKMRELSVKLDSEKARVAKLQQTIIKYERQQSEINEAERKGVLLPSSSMGAANGGNNNNNAKSAQQLELQYLNNQVTDLKQKLDRATSQNASLRAQTEKYDRDMSKVKKILANEIGDETLVEKLLLLSSNNNNNNVENENQNQQDFSTGGYRGRAQTISLLQSKVKELTRQLQRSGGGGDIGDGVSSVAETTTTTFRGTVVIKDYDSVHRSGIAQQESKKSLEIRQLQQSLEESKEQTTKEKQRGDALSSRIHVLEKQLQQLKSSLQQVIQKTENDNDLIDAYKQEVESQRDEIRQISAKLQQQQQSSSLSSITLSSSPQKYLPPPPPQQQQIITTNTNNSNPADVQKIQLLEKEVLTLQRQLATIKTQQHQNNNNYYNNKPTTESSSVVNKIENLDSAMNIVEAQRKMVLSLERKLQEVMNGNDYYMRKLKTITTTTTSSSGDPSVINITLTQALRDENSSLKERISALTGMIDREIELKRLQLEARYAAKQNNNNNSNNNNIINGNQNQQQPTITQNAVSSVALQVAAKVVPSPPLLPATAVEHEDKNSNKNNNNNIVSRGTAITTSTTSSTVVVPKRSVRPDVVVAVTKKVPVTTSTTTIESQQIKKNNNNMQKKSTAVESDEDDDGGYDEPPKFDRDDVLDSDNDDCDDKHSNQRRENNNSNVDDDEGEIDLSKQNNKRNSKQQQRDKELGSKTTSISIGVYAQPLSLRGL